MKKCKFCDFQPVEHHFVGFVNGECREIASVKLVGEKLEKIECNSYEIQISENENSPYISIETDDIYTHIPISYCPRCGRNLDKDYKEYKKWINI